jgi:hypothetical protein
LNFAIIDEFGKYTTIPSLIVSHRSYKRTPYALTISESCSASSLLIKSGIFKLSSEGVIVTFSP